MKTIRKKSDYRLTIILLIAVLFTSCKSSSTLYSAARKFPAEELREDYRVLRTILEKQHPALYWYTPKDSMDLYFDRYYNVISDSMTRQEFGFRVLAPLTAKIRCGHTSFSYPSRYNQSQRNVPSPSFPLYIRTFPAQTKRPGDTDTMVVLSNLNKSDSILKKGTIITSINGYTPRQMVDSFFQFMTTDGYATGNNYVRLSMAFPSFHRIIFGLSPSYEVGYIDSTGYQRSITVPLYTPPDSAARRDTEKPADVKRPSKKERRKRIRNFEVDTANHLGVMAINSFDNGGRLRSFYRKSFRELRKENISNLVIDLRVNGGGRVDNYTALARYIRQEPFKVADSVISVVNWLGNEKKYYTHGFVNSLVLYFGSRKKQEREYHFRYWERKTFKPRTKNHFSGQVYVLIAGPTFSASSLFASTVREQNNVTLVGEETGGGWYGNSGMLIPAVLLPHSRMKIRMPLHRIVQYRHGPKNGRGVMPEITVPATVENLRNNIDGKMQKVIELVRENAAAKGQPHPLPAGDPVSSY